MALTRNGHITKRNIPDGYELVPPDGNYAWIVAFACFFGGLVTTSSIPIFSVLLNDLMKLYKTDTATISLVTSIYAATGNLFGATTLCRMALLLGYSVDAPSVCPVDTVILNTFGVRKSAFAAGLIISFGMTTSYFVNRIELLCVTYGIINGFGMGLANICYPIVLSQYFRKYYSVAVGLLVAGYASSRLVFTPITQLLLQEYGSREVFLILGASVLNACVAATMFQPIWKHLVLVPIDDERKHLLQSETVEFDENDTEDVIRHEDICVSQVVTSNVAKDEVPSSNCCCLSWCSREICSKIDFSLLREPCFYIVSLNGFLHLSITIYTNLYLFPLGVEKGNSPLELTTIVSAKAIAEIVARIAGPSVVTYFNLSVRKSYICIGFVNGVTLIAILFIDNYIEIMIWSMVSGIGFGSMSTLSRVLTVETMGTQQLSSVLGLSTFITGCLMLPVAPILGWIRDTTGSFDNVYIALAILQFVTITLWIIKPYLRQKPPQFSF